MVIRFFILQSHYRSPLDFSSAGLEASEKALKRIGIVYKTLPNQKEEKAHVELWGLKTNSK